jgi:hypothetical protein
MTNIIAFPIRLRRPRQPLSRPPGFADGGLPGPLHSGMIPPQLVHRRRFQGDPRESRISVSKSAPAVRSRHRRAARRRGWASSISSPSGPPKPKSRPCSTRDPRLGTKDGLTFSDASPRPTPAMSVPILSTSRKPTNRGNSRRPACCKDSLKRSATPPKCESRAERALPLDPSAW